jgi:hypothetical protein
LLDVTMAAELNNSRNRRTNQDWHLALFKSQARFGRGVTQGLYQQAWPVMVAVNFRSEQGVATSHGGAVVSDVAKFAQRRLGGKCLPRRHDLPGSAFNL